MGTAAAAKSASSAAAPADNSWATTLDLHATITFGEGNRRVHIADFTELKADVADFIRERLESDKHPYTVASVETNGFYGYALEV